MYSGRMTEENDVWGLVDVAGVLKLISEPSTSFGGRLKLQKMTMLGKLDEEINYPFSFEFIKYHYGPYSKELKKMVRRLVKLGYINEYKRITNNQRRFYKYKLTKKGEELLEDLKDKSELNQDLSKIDLLWEKYQNFNNDNLVKRAKDIYGW